MRGRLNFSYWFHQGIAYHNRYIRAGVTRGGEGEPFSLERDKSLVSLPFGLAGQFLEILLGEYVRCVAQMNLEHDKAGMRLR